MLSIDEIRAELKDKNLTKVAEFVGVHRNVLYRIRKGGNPSYETLIKLSKYLEDHKASIAETLLCLESQMREKRAADIEKCRLKVFARNSATKVVKTSIEHGFLRRQGRIQGWMCAFCCTSIKDAYHIDHIIPVSRGGTGHEGNLQLLCPRCNLSKGAKTRMEYIASGGRVVDGY